MLRFAGVALATGGAAATGKGRIAASLLTSPRALTAGAPWPATVSVREPGRQSSTAT